MRKFEFTDGEAPMVRAALSAHRDKLEAAIRQARRAKDREYQDTLTDELRMANDIIREIDRGGRA